LRKEFFKSWGSSEKGRGQKSRVIGELFLDPFHSRATLGVEAEGGAQRETKTREIEETRCPNPGKAATTVVLNLLKSRYANWKDAGV